MFYKTHQPSSSNKPDLPPMQGLIDPPLAIVGGTCKFIGMYCPMGVPSLFTTLYHIPPHTP